MIAEIDRGLALIDERFTELAANGDERANRFLESLTRARAELDTLAAQAGTQDDAIGSLAERTDRAAREHRAAGERDPRRASALRSAKRRAAPTGSPKPRRRPGRRSAGSATRRSKPASGSPRPAPRSPQQHERFAALLASVDSGVEDAQSKLAELASTLVQVEREAASLSAETGPALVASLVQVKEAAAHAADRAREAIEAAIPEAAGKLSDEDARRRSSG